MDIVSTHDAEHMSVVCEDAEEVVWESYGGKSRCRVYAGRTSGFGKGRTSNRLERIPSAPRHEGGGVWGNKKESVRNCVLENTS